MKMKNFFLLPLFVLLFIPTMIVFAKPDDVPEMVIFSQAQCSHCHDMMVFVDDKIRPNYPNLKIIIHDVSDPDKIRLLRRYLRDYKLDTGFIGTPMTFVGRSHFMGWSPDYENQLIAEIDNYLSDEKEK